MARRPEDENLTEAQMRKRITESRRRREEESLQIIEK